MTDVEVKFNDLIGNEPDPQGNLPPTWVKIEGTTTAPPQGVRIWVVNWVRPDFDGQLAWTNPNGFTFGGVEKSLSFLCWETAEVFADPPAWDPRLPSGVDPWAEFWSVLLWHEWQHSVHADPVEVGRPPGTPKVSEPDFADDHLDLKRREIYKACDVVCQLITDESFTGQNCKAISILCKYIKEQCDGMNSPKFRADLERQNPGSTFPPEDPGPPAVYCSGCLCCATYQLSLCSTPVDGATFVDNSFPGQ